jgi:hypothetical protein
MALAVWRPLPWMGLWLVGACGCPDGRDLPTASTASAIVGGSVTTTQAAVVALLSNGAPYCTGTLIGPRLVVTAAHCLDGITPDAIAVGDATGTAARAQVANTRIDPGFDPVSLVNDIGIVLLSADAPVPPVAPLAPEQDTLTTGTSLLLVGFGRTSADAAVDGLERDGAITCGALTATTVGYSGAVHACEGDSGGPALVTVSGVEYVAAVTSSGNASCTADAVGTRVSAFYDELLAPYLALGRASSANVGEPCLADSACVSGTCEPAPDEPKVAYCTTPCSADQDCPAGLACDAREGGARMCTWPAPSPGAFGGSCGTSSECASALCVDGGTSDAGFCSVRCFTQNASPCPPSYDCRTNPSAPTTNACFPGAPPSTSGCNAASRPADALAGVGMLAVGAALAGLRRVQARRRRRRGARRGASSESKAPEKSGVSGAAHHGVNRRPRSPVGAHGVDGDRRRVVG